MPFLSPELLRHLIQEAARNPMAWAVVPESDSPYGIEPFCAWYSARCRALTREFLAAGGGPARDLVAALPSAVRVPVREVARFGDPSAMFLSVNTPGDLARARAISETGR